jgi:hypothetical protein
VKNKSLSFAVLAIAIASALFILACEKQAQVAEYKKYENDAAVPRISVEDAKKEVDAGRALIVDSRGDAAYKSERIAGSINFPAGATDEQFATLPKDKKIIVYCS